MMKKTIITITYNIPVEVFILQIEAIKKFCKDTDYDIWVVDNSFIESMADGIRYHAERLGANYIRTKASSVNGSDSHSFAANFIYQKLENQYRLFCFLDHDCIPVRDFSIEKILKFKVAAGIGQSKSKTYFWPGCFMVDPQEIASDVDFSPNTSLGLDTGGETYRIIEEVGEDNVEFFDEVHHENKHFRGKYKSYAMINKDMFIHFINGSNWNNEKLNQERLNSLINITKQMTGL